MVRGLVPSEMVMSALRKWICIVAASCVVGSCCGAEICGTSFDSTLTNGTRVTVCISGKDWQASSGYGEAIWNTCFAQFHFVYTRQPQKGHWLHDPKLSASTVLFENAFWCLLQCPWVIHLATWSTLKTTKTLLQNVYGNFLMERKRIKGSILLGAYFTWLKPSLFWCNQ